jgi:signal-transduction protein with cAMP-binding, CBS, and nucleotidyltransferase domain
MMEKNNIKRLPITNADRITGIVTRTNLLRAVANLAREIPDPTADDDHIRDPRHAGDRTERLAVLVCKSPSAMASFIFTVSSRTTAGVTRQ